MRIWSYKTRIGTLQIIEQPNGLFCACCSCEEGNSYDSPDAAADDFFSHNSGCDRWDNSSCEIPDGLGEWVLHDNR